MDGVQLPQGYSYFEEAVYFLPYISGWLESSEFCWKAESTLTVLIETIGDVIGVMQMQSEVNLLVATVVKRVAELNNAVDELVVIPIYVIAVAVAWLCVVIGVSLHVGNYIPIITCVSIVFSSCRICISYYQLFTTGCNRFCTYSRNKTKTIYI